MRLRMHHQITLVFLGILIPTILGLLTILAWSDRTVILRQWRHGWPFILGSVALAAVVMDITAFFFVTSPIRQMTGIVRGIAGGDHRRRFRRPSHNEIGDLARVINDVSDQIQRRMEEVNAHRSRLEAVLLSMSDGIMVVDRQGDILLVNQALKTALALPGTPEGRKPLEVIRNVDVQGLVDQALRMTGGVVSRELTVLWPQERTFRVHATPVRRDHRVDGAVLIFHDITELRRLETMRRDFVANVSHEIRTPLTNIKGYTETLLDGALEDRLNARDFLQIIMDDTDRLIRLVDDLLDLARIESGHLELTRSICQARALVDQVFLELQPLANKRGVVLNNQVPKDLPGLDADPLAVRQVLLNLVDNAIKYTSRPDAYVKVEARLADGMVWLGVADNGMGIPEEDLPRVFERFYRVDKARSRSLGGTGLGLSIVKHIVQAHGGEVIARSAVGQGSTFLFSLPFHIASSN